MVVVIKMMFVSKKRSQYTRGPNDTSHHLGALCSFIHGGEVPSWVAYQGRGRAWRGWCVTHVGVGSVILICVIYALLTKE